MMNIIEMLRSLLPVILSGLITFLITKYTYHKNVPLDKLEITYNRIYYPLYKIIKNESVYSDATLEKIRFYIDKYDKYLDKSTLKAFNNLCKSNTKAKQKSNYQILKSNIDYINSYLRRRLGYLEPSIFLLYNYSSKSEKSTLRIVMEVMLINLLVGFSGIINEMFKFLMLGIPLLCFALVGEIIYKIYLFLYYKIRK